jgi:hypothetical protein
MPWCPPNAQRSVIIYSRGSGPGVTVQILRYAHGRVCRLPGRNPHEILNEFLRASLVAQDHEKTLRIEASFGLRRMDTSARRTRSPPSPPVVATMASPAGRPASSACVPVRPILRLPSQPSSARRPIRPSKPHTLPDRLGAVRVVEVEIPSPLRSPARKIRLWCRSSPDTRSCPHTFPASVHTGGAAHQIAMVKYRFFCGAVPKTRPRPQESPHFEKGMFRRLFGPYAGRKAGCKLLW